MRYYLAGLFGAMCIAQWYVPLSIIREQEGLLADGNVYLFKTAPIDPNDPFRGKYITLDFEAETLKTARASEWERNQDVFAVLGKDKDGFAYVTVITKIRPGAGEDFFAAEIRYSNEESVALQFPFDRFYVEESKASEAEAAYSESNSRDGADREIAYAVVRVKNGKAALEDVRIGDRSIVDIVREGRNKPA